MKVKQTHTGHFVGGKEIITVELSNDKGTLVQILNYGTIIQKFIVNCANGLQHDIVLGFDEVRDYLSEEYLFNYPYFGAIIGRYANRIKDGKFTIDAIDYQLAQNNGNDCLHGGLNGFDKKVWEIVGLNETPNPSVTFQYLSVDGEENFPGDLGIQLTFELTNHNELILTYQADTDEATPINLTHHSYFNLGKNDTIIEHIHQINASTYLEQDDNLAVTGNFLPVKNSIFDFTVPRKINDNWNEKAGYDQTYVLDKNYGDLTLASSTTAVDTGLTLKVYTTEPVAHFYTAKFLNVKNGKQGKHYGEFGGFCLETQHHPNAINIPHFPSTILAPDEVYKQTTIYKIVNQ
jgi:aldose 1-epimerase